MANNNYQITASNEIGKGGAKTKAKANIAAVRLLKALEAEQRQATPDEQAVLVKFSGWGTVVDIFTDKPEWAKLQTELKDLLTDTEYESASAAILNAHYTAPEVATAIYEGLERLGFDGGKILDPSMGATGLFEGTLPDALKKKSEIVGIELDSLSGRIAQQLYPEASIHIRAFEDTFLPDDRFDLAVSNFPFSEIGVSDPDYDGLPIKTLHDYFAVKALDKVRPGGLTAFITSTGTMQSASSEGVRELLSERANLVGAMRLPGTAFKQVAGTEVTTDLIVLQKLGDGVAPNGIDWTKLQPSSVLGTDGNALPVNEYYARNPQLMLGTLADDKLHPGRLALHGDGRDIQSAMREAFSSFPEGVYRPASETTQPQQSGILIPPELQERIKPYAYVLHEDQLMRRMGQHLMPLAMEGKKLERMVGMLAIRDAVQSVFAVQLQGGTEQALQEAQVALNQTYDKFTKANGFINQRANKLVFQDDPDYPLLLALENYDLETKTATKTAIFSDRVIQSHREKTTADTPKEALLYSLNERGRVDLDYIARLVDQSEPEVTQALQQEKLIFLDPQKTQWVAEDEYLSGNVKEKLKIAQESAAEDPRYAVNVEVLEAVQPPLIPPGNIEVRLGAAWVPPSDVQNFAKQLLEATDFLNIQYSPFLDIWSVDASYQVLGSVKNTKVHGTERVGALRLIELGLNLKDPVVYDKVDERLVVNQEDTAAARMKLEEIKVAFKDWVWQDPERTERLTNLYNEKFNTFRPRQYNGAHLDLPGSNPAIQLRPHQKNATWRVLQEGNSLLAHCVGAGKTFSVIAAAMEQKRLGLVNKPMVVVPNHLLEQWAGDFKRLYPNSNILAATKDDSSAKNRQELMSRIATGNWDAVIVTHSAFSKLKMSKDAQLDFYHAELAQVSEASSEAKGNGSSRSMIKEFERQKKRLQKRVDEISKSGKDDTVTFEQLGVDQVYIDEAHYFKNLGYSTKMYGIAGLPNTTSDRAFDLFMKCRYLGEQHGESKGVVFATGTPVSNSMAELYTMQRYLQPQALRQIGLSKFDAWASTFGETVTAPEITPAGGYRVKTRFSRFVNIPELMNTFRQVADIQTAEMLKLPVPELKGGKPEVVAVPATDMQLAFVEELAERAENLRDVDPRDDNMLLITTDGRKASLDMRLVNPYVSHERNKVDQLIEDTCQFWEETISQKTTHLIFCDMGTPKEDAGSKTAKQINVEKQFTVYGYIKDGLIARGIPTSEIAFAQEFKTDAKKLEMQQKFNAGKIRVLISGSQLETGFNGQKKLGLESHLTVPWRPDQVEQRDGRILRQGNENPEVQVRRYVTQGRGGRPSFDSYMWQTLETKKKFIAQVMAGNSEVRTMADVAGAALTYAEVKAIATGNPLIMEKATVDNQISLLAAQKRSHLNQQYNTSRELTRLPERIDEIQETIAALKADAQKVPNLETLSVTVQGVAFTDLREAMKVVKARVLEKQTVKDFSDESIGQVGDFDLGLRRGWKDELNLVVRGQQDYQCQIEHTYVGTATNLTELLKSFETLVHKQERYLTENRKRLVELSAYSNVPFSKESELRAALKRQSEINTELGLSKDNAQAAAEAEEERAESEPAVTEGATVAPVPAVQEDRSPVDLSNLSVLPASQQQGRIEKRIATFLDKAGIREAVTAGEGFHLKIENEPYIPLVIERQQDELYLTHYLQQNGDTFIDSEMVFSIKDDGQLQLKETATQNPFQGGESRGCDRIFAQVFSRNVQTQGFGEAACEQLQQPQATEPSVPVDNKETQASEPVNPIYERYCAQKEQYPEAIVFVQAPIGFQTFAQDAERYAEITNANLQTTGSEDSPLLMVRQSRAFLEEQISQVTTQGIAIALVEADGILQLHSPEVVLAQPNETPVVQPETNSLLSDFEAVVSDRQREVEPQVIAPESENLTIEPAPCPSDTAIEQPNETPTSEPEVDSVSEVADKDIETQEVLGAHHRVEFRAEEITPEPMNVPIESTETTADSARETELANGEEILRIAAQMYAFAETQGNVRPDDNLEMWAAQGNFYNITYNPANANFFVEGKNESEMVVQSVAGELDADCTEAVSAVDVQRFQAIEKALSGHDFNRDQMPIKTQAIARDKWEMAKVAAASLLPTEPAPTPISTIGGELFQTEQYASGDSGRTELIDSAGVDPSWSQSLEEAVSKPAEMAGPSQPSRPDPESSTLASPQSQNSVPTIDNALVASLQQWQQQAQDLERPPAYLTKIQALVAAAESGNDQAITDKAANAMQRDGQDWQQQIATISEQAQFILGAIGEADSTGTRFNGKTYAIDCSTEGRLSVEAQDRGEILRVDGSEMEFSAVTATDVARFRSFAKQVAQQAGQPARAPVAAGHER